MEMHRSATYIRLKRSHPIKTWSGNIRVWITFLNHNTQVLDDVLQLTINSRRAKEFIDFQYHFDLNELYCSKSSVMMQVVYRCPMANRTEIKPPGERLRHRTGGVRNILHLRDSGERWNFKDESKQDSFLDTGILWERTLLGLQPNAHDRVCIVLAHNVDNNQSLPSCLLVQTKSLFFSKRIQWQK